MPYLLLVDLTAKFVHMFDKLFDALNVCNFTDGQYQHKPFKSPYKLCTDGEDFRLKIYLFYLLRLPKLL